MEFDVSSDDIDGAAAAIQMTYNRLVPKIILKSKSTISNSQLEIGNIETLQWRKHRCALMQCYIL